VGFGIEFATSEAAVLALESLSASEASAPKKGIVTPGIGPSKTG
jgi:hypothetical protein